MMAPVNALPKPQAVSSVAGARFELGAAEVLGRLQATLRLLIEATPGNTKRPAELAQTLGVHAKLAWQAYRVAYAPDPLSEAGNIPGPASLRRFLEAAARRGAPAERIEAAVAAGRELDALIRMHARSRGEFQTMVTALTSDGSEQVDLVHKRAAFKAQSHILGVQAKTHLACTIHQPSATRPDRLDLAAIRGMIGLRRFRRDASWVISQTRMMCAGDSSNRAIRGEALDPEGSRGDGVNLLTAFCSRPLPELRSVPADLSNMINIEIHGDAVGNASAVTCLVGDAFRGASSRTRTESAQRLVSNMRVRTPCETLVHDVLVHDDIVVEGGPALRVYSDHRDVDVVLEQQIEARECDRLQLREEVIFLGWGLGVVECADVPGYPEMLGFAMQRLGWDAESFRVYRCRIAYPVMPSSVVITFELPERAG